MTICIALLGVFLLGAITGWCIAHNWTSEPPSGKQPPRPLLMLDVAEVLAEAEEIVNEAIESRERGEM